MYLCMYILLLSFFMLNAFARSRPPIFLEKKVGMSLSKKVKIAHFAPNDSNTFIHLQHYLYHGIY